MLSTNDCLQLALQLGTHGQHGWCVDPLPNEFLALKKISAAACCATHGDGGLHSAIGWGLAR